jgi:hypothetical protein
VVGTDVANTGIGSQRPVLSGTGGSSTFKKSLSTWFDRTLYKIAGTPANPYQYGDVRGNTLRSDMWRQYDASIFKNFSMPGETKLSFRVEAFNLPNTTSFAAPGATVTSATCCAVTATSTASRDIQFALKYDF